MRTHAGNPHNSHRGAGVDLTDATAIFFAERWYNVNHLHNVVAPYNNYWYANVAMPAQFDGTTLTWTDLSLDLMHDRDRGIMLKDERECEDHVRNGYYPADIAARIYTARDEMLNLARRSAFPFNREVQIQ